MTKDQFAKLQAWHLADDKRTAEIKMGYSLDFSGDKLIYEPKLSIYVYDGECGEIISPEEIDRIADVLLSRARERAQEAIERNVKLLDRLAPKLGGVA